ncbi:MAG: hypothetical protein JXX28_17005 [Deltaproteobacteria bacterium]|nr:hypothetical protein [Deltaproteobacteria bacterium]
MSLDRSARRQVWLRAWVAALSGRGAKVFAALVLVMLVGFGMYANHLWNAAQLGRCPAVRSSDLPMQDLIALKRRIESYQRDPDEDAMVSLSPLEMSFLLQDTSDYQLYLDIRDEEVSAEVFRQVEGGCVTVVFDGSLTVVDGVLHLQPRTLRIGEADLTAFAVMGLRISASHLRDPEMGRLLSNVARMRIRDGQIQLAFRDRWNLW